MQSTPKRQEKLAKTNYSLTGQIRLPKWWLLAENPLLFLLGGGGGSRKNVQVRMTLT